MWGCMVLPASSSEPASDCSGLVTYVMYLTCYILHVQYVVPAAEYVATQGLLLMMPDRMLSCAGR